MKKKELTILAMGLLLSGVGVVQAQTTLQVQPKSGTLTAYTLSTVRKLTFPVSGSLSVSRVNGVSDSYVLSDLRYLKYADLGTGIQPGAVSKNGLRIYPNPVVDVLSVDWTATEGKPTTIELLSVDGKLHYVAEIPSPTSTKQIQVSHLQKGLYLCRVCDGISVITTKFFKK